jgi:hypothetical protein
MYNDRDVIMLCSKDHGNSHETAFGKKDIRFVFFD